MLKLKGLLVDAMAASCAIADRVPIVRNYLGCPDGLALWSYKLDQKWKTGRWREPQKTRNS